MDTYGLINLTELDRMIEKWELRQDAQSDKTTWQLYDIRIMCLKEIKERCLKLPSGLDVFNAGTKYFQEGCKYNSFEDYITQFIKSDKP